MASKDLKQKIIDHLDGLNKLESETGSDNLVNTIAERYDAPKQVVQQVIAEWSAGKDADPDQDNQ